MTPVYYNCIQGVNSLNFLIVGAGASPLFFSHWQSKPEAAAPAQYTLTFSANVAALSFNQLAG
ncbi:MAG TPA: hypothetical protein VEC93_00320, partial [Anaerolineae bacterium]|nr:hypothetical protein [Anaerolineae bacterium]